MFGVFLLVRAGTLRLSTSDAVDGYFTGNLVPWMWVPIRPPRSEGSKPQFPAPGRKVIQFSAVQNVVLGPLRHLVRRSSLVANGGIADIARPSQSQRSY